MSRMTRYQLKSIVKECLIEILAEGVGEQASSLTESRSRPATRRPARRKASSNLARPRSATLDAKVVANPNFDKNVKKAVNTLTADPLMSSILEDTARTTLQKMTKNDSSLGVNTEQLLASSHRPNNSMEKIGDPLELFEGANKWADLAFAPSRKTVQPE